MIGYKASEIAVQNAIINHFPEMLNDYNCRRGDLDGVVNYMMRNPSKYGVLLEFIGAQRRKPENFNKYIWQWNILITFLVKLDPATIEEDVRDIIDSMASFCEQNRTLDNAVAKFDVSYIDRPNSGKAGDIPVTWINITTYVWDK